MSKKNFSIEDIRAQMENVPFGSSQYQIHKFIAEEEATPERQYRKVLLELHQKLNNLQDCKFRRDRISVDLEELEDKLSKESNKFEVKRHKISIEEKKYSLLCEEKLIEDALFEVATYTKILESLPKVNREQFEKAEQGYWQQRFINDATNQVRAIGRVEPGTLKALNSVGVDVGRDKEGRLAFLEGTPVVPQLIKKEEL